jgi:hypothetical protein
MGDVSFGGMGGGMGDGMGDGKEGATLTGGNGASNDSRSAKSTPLEPENPLTN